MATPNIVIYDRPGNALRSAQAELAATESRLEYAEREAERNPVRLKNSREAYLAAKRRLVTLHRIVRQVGEETFNQIALYDHETYRERSAAFSNRAGEHCRACRSYRARMAEHDQTLATRRRQVAEARQHLARVQATMLDSRLVLDRKASREALKRLPGVDKVTITANDRFVRVTVSHSGLTLQPLAEHREAFDWWRGWVFRRSAVEIPPAAPIAAGTISVKYFAGTGRIAYRACEADNRRAVPSPHWLSVDQPCLGDYAGPIQEAAAELDFVTVFQLLLMYTQTFNMEDVAGVNGMTWALRNGPDFWRVPHINGNRTPYVHAIREAMSAEQAEPPFVGPPAPRNDNPENQAA